MSRLVVKCVPCAVGFMTRSCGKIAGGPRGVSTFRGTVIKVVDVSKRASLSGVNGVLKLSVRRSVTRRGVVHGTVSSVVQCGLIANSRSTCFVARRKRRFTTRNREVGSFDSSFRL